jgi:glycosyltransferase involved in cell wall biosynthesis
VRVLILSYYSPPAGGPGVQRLEMLLRHLPPEVEATVVTATPEDYQALSPLRMPLDRSRVAPADQTVRLPARLPAGWFRLLARCRLYGAVRWFWVPDVARGWAARAVEHAARLHREQPFDVLFSTAPPFSVAFAGRDAARRLDLPWVSDLQDLWTGYLLGAWPSRARWNRERLLERSVLASARQVVVVTPGSRDALLETYPSLDPESVSCVTLGYDPAAWPASAPASPDKFVIAHTGVFCGPVAPAGALRRWVQGRAFEPRPVDRSTHSPAALVQALERLRDPRIEFRHLGPMDAANQHLFEASPMRSQIRVLGYRDHRETLAELASADASYLCLATRLDASRNELVPQKTYEYLGARRPVLAPLQEGDARDLVLASGLGIGTPPGNGAALAALLAPLVEAKFRGRPLTTPREDFIRRFEWQSLSARLWEFLDRAASRSPRPVTVSSEVASAPGI